MSHLQVSRNVSCDDHVVSEAVKSLSENGFVNYFGMQRFGTSTIKTHQIGRYINSTSDNTPLSDDADLSLVF